MSLKKEGGQKKLTVRNKLDFKKIVCLKIKEVTRNQYRETSQT